MARMPSKTSVVPHMHSGGGWGNIGSSPRFAARRAEDQTSPPRQRSISGHADAAAQYALLPMNEADVTDEPPQNVRRERRHSVLSVRSDAASPSCWESFHQAAVEVVDSQEVQLISALAIMLNSLAIGLESDHPGWAGWATIENMFLLFFTLELFVRLIVITPPKYFACSRNPDLVWNIFDFVIVTMGLLDFAQSELAPSLNDRGFSTVFRMIRLFRILRMLRIIRFLKQLYLLAYGLVEAALAIVWVTTFMTFILYICSIVLTRLYGHIPEEDPDHEFLTDHFGSVPSAMLTLFELMSQPDLASYTQVLTNHPSILPFLVIFIIFGSFGMIALLTGVISECMFEKNKAKLDEERLEREKRRNLFQQACAELYSSIDEDDNGHVTSEELLQNKERINELVEGAGMSFSDNQWQQIFDALDEDASGFVTKHEFENGVMQMCEDIHPMSIMELHNCIRKTQVQVDDNSRQMQTRIGGIEDQLGSMAASIESIKNAVLELRSTSEAQAGAAARRESIGTPTVTPRPADSQRGVRAADAAGTAAGRSHASSFGESTGASTPRPLESRQEARAMQGAAASAVSEGLQPWQALEAAAQRSPGAGHTWPPSAAEAGAPGTIVSTRPAASAPPLQAEGAAGGLARTAAPLTQPGCCIAVSSMGGSPSAAQFAGLPAEEPIARGASPRAPAPLSQVLDDHVSEGCRLLEVPPVGPCGPSPQPRKDGTDRSAGLGGGSAALGGASIEQPTARSGVMEQPGAV